MTNQQEITDEQVAQYRAAFEAKLRNYKGKTNEQLYSEKEIQEILAYEAQNDGFREDIRGNYSPEYIASIYRTWW